MDEIPIPQAIHRGEREIVITWGPDHRATYPARYLRLRCHCAQCRDELTGQLLLDGDRVPQDVSPRRVELVGSYAFRVDWSDGHNTGIYTYQYLREICPCERCEAERLASGKTPG